MVSTAKNECNATMSMWEPFTEEGRRTMVLAQEASQKIGNSFIAPEHVLLGVIAQEQSNAAKVLAEFDVTYEKAFEAARASLGSFAGGPARELIFTPRAKMVIEAAFGEARDLSHNYIGAEHLVLGIIREGHSATDNFLTTLQIDDTLLRTRLIQSFPAAGAATSQAPFTKIHHVQLAMPEGAEDRARSFYVDVLGMHEAGKPAELAARGGLWFVSDSVEVHLGVDRDFHPATKAHPALRCRDYQAMLARLRERGVDVQSAPDSLSDGCAHSYVSDPFGNRLELVG